MEYGDEKLPQRFWDKVSPEPNTGCWFWVGGITGRGYGTVWMHGKNRKVHHLTNGHPGAGMHTDHLCRVRSCVNPEHLEVVTPAVNSSRGDCGKHLSDRTHCPQGHEYSGHNLIVRHTPQGYTSRFCRECKNADRRRRRARKKAQAIRR